MSTRGNEFHGEVSNADSGVAFTLYQAGTTNTITLASNQRLVIEWFVWGSTNKGLVTLAFSTDAGGKRAIQFGAPTSVPAVIAPIEFFGLIGVVPVLINIGGNANYATIGGYILDEPAV